MKIGTFNLERDGSLSGHITSPALDLVVDIRPIEGQQQEEGKRPTYRVYLAGTDQEIGAGWRRTSKHSGKNYVSVQFDDPTWEQPFSASLVKEDDRYMLYWNRSRSQQQQPLEAFS